jgi:Cft2 family RNA processing exonuclease
VNAYVRGLRPGSPPFSALTLLDRIEVPRQHKKSPPTGEINKALHKLWADGELVAYVDESGGVLREKAFGKPGSAAQEHPQIFGLPRAASPDPDYQPMAYAEYCNRGHLPEHGDEERAAPAGVADAEPADVEPAPAPPATKPRRRAASGAKSSAKPAAPPAEPPPEEVALPFASDDDAERQCNNWRPDESVPEWLPDRLLAGWCSRPALVAGYREVLAGGDEAAKKLLVQTKLKRKGGTLDPESDTAQKLAALCHNDPWFWEFTMLGVMADSLERDQLIDHTEWRRFFGRDWVELTQDHSCESVLLSGMRLGMDLEALELLADEAFEELAKRRESSQTDVRSEDVGRLSTTLQERKRQLHEARDESRELKRRTTELERQLEAERNRSRNLRERLETAAAESSEEGGELDRAMAEFHEREQAWAQQRAQLEEQIGELKAIRDGLEERLEEQDGEDDEDWEGRALALEVAFAREQAEHERLDAELQDSYRNAIELRDQVERLLADAGELPTPDDAGSLLDVLDAAVGAASREAAEHLTLGEATEEDQLVLQLATQVIEFKRALAEVAAARPEPPVEATLVQVVETADVGDAAAPADEEPEMPSDEPEAPGEQPAPEAAYPLRDQLRERRLQRSTSWSVRPIGGAGEIGGSAVVATSPDGQAHILLDCGQRVPGSHSTDGNRSCFHFGIPEVRQVDAILVTHAHLDHVGSLPVLYRSPMVDLQSCRILMSAPTMRLARIMLDDSAKLQNTRRLDLQARAESDLDVDHTFAKPAYDLADVERVMASVEEAPAYEELDLGCGVTATFLPVAHVLGSCAVRLRHVESGRTLLYTGDLGPLSGQLLSLPHFGGLDLLPGADVVLMESTYGDVVLDAAAPQGRRLPGESGSPRERSVTRLLRLMRKTIDRGGFVLLPSFALGRTQELARILGTHWGSDIPQALLYLAGMGEQIVDVYSDYEHHRAKGETQWVNPGFFPRTERLAPRAKGTAAFADIVDEVLSGPPAYILATPAAMGGGWSQWFAERMVGDKRNAVAFTGFVPNGDRPYSIGALHTGSQLRCLDKSRRTIECDWERFSLSSHAQRDDLLLFAADMVAKKPDCRIGVLHGTPRGQASLVKEIAAAHGDQRAVSLSNNREWAPGR